MAGLVLEWAESLSLWWLPCPGPTQELKFVGAHLEPGFMQTVGELGAIGATQGHGQWLVLGCAKNLGS